MRCPNCGQDNAEGVRFCGNCGTALVAGAEDTAVLPPAATEPPASPPVSGPPPPTPPAPPLYGATVRPEDAPAPPPPPPSKVAEALTTGWGRAVGSAALTFLIMVLMGQGLAALVYVSGSDGLGIGDVMKGGGLLTFSFHRVGMHAEFPPFSPPGLTDSGLDGLPQVGGGLSLAFTVAFALLLGTIVLVWLLHRAGRALGDQVLGGSAWARGLAGAKVALPYAAIAGVAALVLAAFPMSLPVPVIPGLTAGGNVELAPSVVAAFVWPLVLGLLAGFAGGVSSASRAGWEAPSTDRFVVGALRGGVVGVGFAVLLAFVGVQVVAFLHPDVAFPFSPQFFTDAFAQDRGVAGVSTVVFALFLAPNMGGLVLAPSMLSSLGFHVEGTSITLLSLFEFPVGLNPEALAGLSGIGVPGIGGGEIVETQVAPWPYWLFLLVPLVATWLGGRAAARRAQAGTAGEGAAAGALAGLVFAGLAFLVVVLSGVGMRFEIGGISQAGVGHFGGDYLTTGLLAVLWGLVGGTLGGLVGVNERPAVAAPEGATYGFGGRPEPPPPPV